MIRKFLIAGTALALPFILLGREILNTKEAMERGKEATDETREAIIRFNDATGALTITWGAVVTGVTFAALSTGGTATG
jgi:hypothetical protein